MSLISPVVKYVSGEKPYFNRLVVSLGLGAAFAAKTKHKDPYSREAIMMDIDSLRYIDSSVNTRGEASGPTIAAVMTFISILFLVVALTIPRIGVFIPGTIWIVATSLLAWSAFLGDDDAQGQKYSPPEEFLPRSAMGIGIGIAVAVGCQYLSSKIGEEYPFVNGGLSILGVFLSSSIAIFAFTPAPLALSIGFAFASIHSIGFIGAVSFDSGAPWIRPGWEAVDKLEALLSLDIVNGAAQSALGSSIERVAFSFPLVIWITWILRSWTAWPAVFVASVTLGYVGAPMAWLAILNLSETFLGKEVLMGKGIFSQLINTGVITWMLITPLSFAAALLRTNEKCFSGGRCGAANGCAGFGCARKIVKALKS